MQRHRGRLAPVTTPGHNRGVSWGTDQNSGCGLHDYRSQAVFDAARTLILFEQIILRGFPASLMGKDMDYFVGVFRWGILVSAILACAAVSQIGIVGF